MLSVRGVLLLSVGGRLAAKAAEQGILWGRKRQRERETSFGREEEREGGAGLFSIWNGSKLILGTELQLTDLFRFWGGKISAKSSTANEQLSMTPDFARKSVLRDHKLAQLEGHSEVGRWGDYGRGIEQGDASKIWKKIGPYSMFYGHT